MKCFEKCHAGGRRIPRGMGLMKDERGFSLIETLIAIALLGIIGVAFLSGLSTASKVLFITDERETAKNLAESQMENVKDQVYEYDDPQSYEQPDTPSTDYPDYTISINADPLHPADDGIQKITVVIKHHGKEVITLEGYKVDR